MTNQTRIAVVTGGNRGIGREVCRQLARQGYRVILGSRDPTHGNQAAMELAAEGLRVTPFSLDVTDAGQVEGLAAFAEHEFGQLDALVNNAGVFPRGREHNADSTLHADADAFRQAIEVNVLGALRMCQALAPLMRRCRYGRIVNVSSGMGQLSDMGGGHGPYRISKTALNALTRILAAELANDNILVNAVCPGWVRTDMGGSNAPRTVAEGADTIVWAATLPEGGPTGRLFRDRQAIPW